MSEYPGNVLVIAVSRIGDTLFATPAIRAISRAWPEARITVLGHPKRAEVLEHLPWVHRVGAISKGRAPWMGRFGGTRYDIAFVFGFDEPLVAYALRVSQKVIAFRQADERLNARLYAAVPLPAFQSEHSVLQLLRLPAAAGVAPAGLRIAFRTTADEAAEAQRLLENEGLAGRQPLIGLQVASFPTKAYRDWPIEAFEELCRRILARWPQAGFLIYGGTEEKERTAWLKRQFGDRAALFAGRLTLRQTAALMSLTDLYVGVDTGPTHIMSAFDVPMVALYHCLSPSTLTGPLEHPCAYLLDHPTGREQCDETSTMAQIPVDAVFAQVERALTEHPPRPR